MTLAGADRCARLLEVAATGATTDRREVVVGRFQASWQLLGSSWSVLKADKELTVVPVVSTVTSLVIAGVLGAGAYFTLQETATVGSTSGSYELSATPLTYVVGVVAYLVLAVVVTFFTGVLCSGAYQRLSGGDPSLGSAFAGATSRFPQLALWGLLTGTVGLILQAIRERAGFLGDIVASIVGAAWDIVTWLAIPVVIVEGTGPIASLKRSASLFKQTWGENLIAQAGFGLAGFVIMLPGLVLFGALSVVVPFVGIPLLVVWIVAVAVVLSTLGGIYRTALYLYASTGQAPQGFDQNQMASSFRSKVKA